MSNPHYGSNSSPHYIPTSYNSLRDAGMSYPRNNSQSGPEQMYPPSGTYQHPQNYGMAAPAGVPEYPRGAQYPSTLYSSSGGQYQSPAQWMGTPAPQPVSPEHERYMAVANAGMASQYGSTPSPAGHPYVPGHAEQYPPPPEATSSHGRHEMRPMGVRQCRHCGAMSTPLWRRDPKTQETLCNACGVYLQQRHSHRPQQLIDADNDASDDGSYGVPANGPECNHCHTRQTSVWRRDKEGNQVCNACGVYQRTRGVPRPLELKRNKPKPRAKLSPC